MKNKIRLLIFLFIIFDIFIVFLVINFISFNKSISSRPTYISSNDKINKKPLIIDVDVSGRIGKFGPAKFMHGIYEVLPYNTSNCIFIPHDKILPSNANNKSDFIYLPCPSNREHIYNEWARGPYLKKLIFGPLFVPGKWLYFPQKQNWNERRFGEISNSIKAMAFHSDRNLEYISQRSNTTHLIDKKFMIIRPCTNMKPKHVKAFNERTIDILFFEKYADLNYRKEGKKLLLLLNNSSKKVEKISYGSYEKENMIKMANDTKFIIYFSFYDTGAIGLKEIQNHGVYAFTVQKDLAYDNETSCFIRELAELEIENAYNVIMDKIEKITKSKPNSQFFATKNQEHNKCENVFEDLCNRLNKMS